MSYQALYRKWRPATFDEIVGQDAVVTTLKNQVRTDRIGHAYLFCGTRGTGKTSAAKIFARAVNCPHAAEHDGSPCNSCEVCEAIRTGRAMNVFEIDAASNNGVDNIRDIRDQVEYPPVTGRFKVYIIDEAHMLSTGAFNALLKTLEEPPSYVIFILATTDPQKIPPTILSRCQRYDFHRMSRRTAATHLREITALEGMKIEDRALSYIAEAADGSMRDALSLLDQCAAYHYGETLTYDNVLEILGAADTGVYSALYGQVVRGEIEEALKTVNELTAAGSDISQLINDFIWYLRTVLLAGSDASADILDISEERLMMARADAALTSRQDLIMIMSALAELGNRARFSPQTRVLLEVELIRLCTRHTIQAAASDRPSDAGGRSMDVPGRTAKAESRPGDASRAPADTLWEASGEAGRAAETAEPGSIRARLQAERRRNLEAEQKGPDKAPEPMSARITVELNDRRQDTVREEPVPEVWQAEEPVPEIGEPAEQASPKPQAEGQNQISRQPEATPAEEEIPPVSASEEFPEEERGDRLIDELRHNWADMVNDLSPSNRTLFSGVMLKEEQGSIVLLFRNKINYTLAARNPEENGVLRLRELARERLGIPVSFMARIAKPGEIEAVDNRMTDEELSRIRFHVEFEN